MATETLIDLQNSRILITGGSGFLGRQVVQYFREQGCKNLFAPRRSDYDLRHEAQVIKLYHDIRPDIVIHLAATVGGIGANRENPGRFFYDNMLMGILLIEQARLAGVKKFVTIGTVCAYPKFAAVPFKEDDLWSGYPEETNAPYGLAKKMLLVQSQAYRQQYGFNAIYLLPVNLYGPWDNFDLDSSHVIPALIRKCLTAKANGDAEIICWGDGSPTREFLHVTDCARAIWLATEKYNGPDPVNIGTNSEISIADLTELIRELCDYPGRITWDISKPNGQPRRCLDTSRAWEYFGFRAQISLTEGLRQTIDWYQENSQK